MGQPPRFHVALPLAAGLEATLPEAAAQHVRVLRLQRGAPLVLFDGADSVEWHAELRDIGKATVTVRIVAAHRAERELPLAVTLALGMPANERMDTVVEKATELGAAALQPLVCERSVLRLSSERAERRLAHWRGVSVAAAEQCGRARLPGVHPVRALTEWLGEIAARPTAPAATAPAATAPAARLLLSLADDALPLVKALCPVLRAGAELTLLSGPEGGLSPAEETAARATGFVPVSLGPRVLRADTAPLAALAALAALVA